MCYIQALIIPNLWSINQLFSKYIFCEYKQEVKMGVNGGTYIQKILVVFFFDVINAESFKYMWSMCRAFQYEIQYDEFDICFWAEKKEESDYIKENFISILASGEGKDSIEKEVLEKIKIKVLLNRKLNVVDN